MTKQRDPRLAEFTDSELRGEINAREEERRRAFFAALDPCEVCGASITGYETNMVEEFRSAPGWQGWPAPPPIEFTQVDGGEYETKLTCENGHETYRKDVKFFERSKSA